ncbi:MAG: chromosomal replication initiator protein DnaA [Bordetella sp.]|nr:MAG: chromosomal replication initiator protein DnaA [Bordetella sp.]
MKKLWKICVDRLEQDIPPQQISAWIRPLIPLSFDEKKAILRISAPNRFKLEWVRKQFLHKIEMLATEYFGKPVQVLFELPMIENTNKLESLVELNKEFGNSMQSINSTKKIQKLDMNNYFDCSKNIFKSKSFFNIPFGNSYEQSRLNICLTFENFITGKANQLAHAAALQVAESPGVSYNPLFLYGGVGLGKTHLMHSIGNSMIKSKNNIRVRYVHADQYVSDVVKAYQSKTFDEFKQYYHSLDLLLIDDIQFFSGKNRTQEEFFLAFEAMLAQRKQIIIASDAYPKELSGIDSRLISRFDSGLTVAIEPPELEMRVEILLRKAKFEKLSIPEEVIFFIAKRLRNNVRELEGALHKVLAYTRFHKCQILTIDTCQEALKDLFSVSNGQISIENIQKIVADYYKIKLSDMYSKRRPYNIALPRQIAMYLSKELTQKSLPEIGDLFGGRDHTTVLHAVKKISDARIKQTDLNHVLHILEQMLKG